MELFSKLTLLVINEQFLRYDSELEIGRSEDYRNDPNSLLIEGLKVPKNFFTIKVMSPNDGPVTPLSIRIRSRMPLKINDSKYYLKEGESPLIVDFTDRFTDRFIDQENHLRFKIERGSSKMCQITLKWVPFNIYPYSGLVLINNIQQQNPLVSKIQEVCNLKIDLRLCEDIFLATHYVTLLSQKNHELRIALLRGIPIVYSTWLDCIKDEFNDIKKWSINLSNFLPPSRRGDNLYMMPSQSRDSLFQDSFMVVFVDDTKKKTRELVELLGCLSALIERLRSDKYFKSDKLDGDLLKEDIKKISKAYNPERHCFIMTELNEDLTFTSSLKSFAESLNGEIVTEESLFNCIKYNSKSSLKPLCLSQNETDTQIRRRKRRKIEKASGLDFFDFTPSISTPAPNETQTQTQQIGSFPHSPITIDESSQKQNTETDIRKTLQSAQKAMTESTRALNGIERGSISPVSKQHEPEGFEPTEPEPKQPKPKELELNFMEHKGLAIEETTESSSKRSAPLELRHDQPDRKKLKLKEPEKIGKFMPSISLIDAIRNTKEEQEQVVKKELGLDGSDQPLDEKLKDLAIVELFEIKLRSPKLAEAERTHLSFKGRKNFKRFNKNQKSKSALSRSFLDLEPITLDNKITFKSEDQGDTDATTDLELNMTKDFDGLMDDVNGYQPQGPAFVEHDEKSDNEEGFSFGKGESLFVPADSQNSPAKPRHIPIRKVSHGGNDNDDDDDDDDDEPRFAFSR